MDHPSTPSDSGAAAASAALRVAAGRKGKVGSTGTSSSIGRGSSRAADLFPVGGRSGSSAGLLPFGRGSSPPAGLLPFGRGSMAASGTAESSPIGFTFPPSPPAGASPGSSSVRHSDATWDNDTQGGFMRYFGNQPHNFHLVGTPSHNSHVNISIPETNGESSPSEVEFLSEQLPVLVNDENAMVRTEKRIMWTPQEDERLMSAWIENSTDSTTGADRKGEAYWGDVIKAYNKETPPQRKRNAKQAKDRWHKINRWCDLFEYEYLKARRVFTSGYSDEMWMDTAEKFYLDHKLGPSVIKNVWKICRKVSKWKTYNEELKIARKRKSYHLEEDVENVDSEDEMPKRPIGQKAAKKSALAAKGKSKAMGDDGKSEESAIHVEKLDKLSKIQEEVNANRMKVLEMQQKLSSDKIETTRLTHLTAQENK